MFFNGKLREKAFFDLIGRIREALKDLLFSDADRAKFNKIQQDIVEIETTLSHHALDLQGYAKQLESFKMETTCLKTTYEGVKRKLDDHSVDLSRIFKQLSAVDECIGNLANEQHRLKEILSLVAKSIQDKINE